MSATFEGEVGMEIPTGGKRRRSRRLRWRTSILVHWMDPNGVKVREHAKTEVVNAHGALLRLKTLLPLGKPLELIQPRSKQIQAARVVWTQKDAGQQARAGVELSTPSQNFWGIYIPF